MSSNYTHHLHGCQDSSSAAVLELVELISSVAETVSELPANSSTTDSASHCADSAVRMLSDLLVYAVVDDSCIRSPDIQVHLGFLYESARRVLQRIDQRF
ncbi:hypothetical protein HO173_012808 [Letharia columbiana]|uniref:Uncharacterized protein n=1 Tax=Letharia columbiana TaxID=112416 RepID=A0A8H6CKV7_9LECA|nr:uncharacterized protein HO173_012808 [Letharia columbiana]KAF6225323.1 hypothetical protein HO173_012808 [Letharia columbiana]